MIWIIIHSRYAILSLRCQSLTCTTIDWLSLGPFESSIKSHARHNVLIRENVVGIVKKWPLSRPRPRVLITLHFRPVTYTNVSSSAFIAKISSRKRRFYVYRKEKCRNTWLKQSTIRDVKIRQVKTRYYHTAIYQDICKHLCENALKQWQLAFKGHIDTILCTKITGTAKRRTHC